jgi:hypothetical protein
VITTVKFMVGLSWLEAVVVVDADMAACRHIFNTMRYVNFERVLVEASINPRYETGAATQYQLL